MLIGGRFLSDLLVTGFTECWLCSFIFCCWPGHWDVGRMLARGVTGTSLNISFPYFWVWVFVIRPIAQNLLELFDESVGFPGLLHVLQCEHKDECLVCCCMSPGTGCSRPFVRSNNVVVAHIGTIIYSLFFPRNVLWWLWLLWLFLWSSDWSLWLLYLCHCWCLQLFCWFHLFCLLLVFFPELIVFRFPWSLLSAWFLL